MRLDINGNNINFKDGGEITLSVTWKPTKIILRNSLIKCNLGRKDVKVGVNKLQAFQFTPVLQFQILVSCLKALYHFFKYYSSHFQFHCRRFLKCIWHSLKTYLHHYDRKFPKLFQLLVNINRNVIGIPNYIQLNKFPNVNLYFILSPSIQKKEMNQD